MLEKIPGAKIRFAKRGHYLIIKLPGRRIFYPKVQVNRDGTGRPQLSYMGLDSQRQIWTRIHTHPGKLVENIVQATARDLLVWGMLVAEVAGYKIVGHAHDEAIAETTPDQNNFELCAYLTTKPKWATTLPLTAEGYDATRYRKD